MRIFKWSVIPTEKLQRLKYSQTELNCIMRHLSDGIHDGYSAVPDDVRRVWRVLMLKPGAGFVTIRTYPYGDDPEYARLCAGELCEKLNERM